MDVTTPSAAYDPFAWFYNRYWGPEFCQDVFPVFERLLLPLLPPPARILDLCCGTGQIAGRLAELGYEVTGLDGSAAMLSFARHNAPAARFLQADVRNFTLPEGTGPFDLVVSSFDSLNHILTLAELNQVFRNVERSLTPGGLFSSTSTVKMRTTSSVRPLTSSVTITPAWCGAVTDLTRDSKHTN